MKKICYITTISLTLKVFVLELAEELHEKYGYDITFICNSDDEFEKQLPDYIHFIPVNMKRGMDSKGIMAVLQLFKTFKKNQYDYIQYSTPNASFYASIAAWFARCPVRLYGQWGIRYVGESGVKRRILKMFEKITCKLSTHIRAISQENMNFAIREGLYKTDKAKLKEGGTIGISFENFDITKKEKLREATRQKYNINNNTFVFGYVGRICRDKGIAELLMAFRELSKEGIQTKLFVVGSREDDGLDPDLLNWSENCEDIIYTGRCSVEELPCYYSAFDCYVHPTYREGFCTTLQEAGAMGNAIITTDVPGAAEVMEPGVSCIVVPSKDYKELNYSMRQILEDKAIANVLGGNAYIRTKNLYERSIVIEKIVCDMEEILEHI